MDMIEKMDQLQLKAYAKINIGLDVLQKLENGYHEVKMIMQTISLHDTLDLERSKTPGIVLETDHDKLSGDSSNLANRAAELLFDAYSLSGGVKINLKKRIPIAAGMAGGSTDAAAVLRGMNRMFGLDLPEPELMNLAVKLGADVPYCLVGGTYLAEGIGEKLTRTVQMPECFVLVARPAVCVSTKWVYDNLHAGSLKEHPDIDRMLRKIEAGDLKGLAGCMGNVLQNVTCKKYPVVLEIIKKMEAWGAEKAMMSGSGPTVFGLFCSKMRMQEAYERLRMETMVQDLFLCSIQHAYGEPEE